MASDPQRQEQMRRTRLLMLLMMIPWVIMMFYTNKQQKAMQEQARLKQSQPVAAVQELDPTKKVDEQVQQLRGLIAQDPKSEQSQRYKLMIAALLDENGFYDQACQEYEAFASSFKGSPYTAHALYQAGRIARDQLKDEKRFVKDVGRLGYETKRCIWDPEAKGDPTAKFIAATVAVRELDPVYRKGSLYRALDWLVLIFDPQNHPEYAYAAGLVLLGLLARLLLWHLTAWGYRASKVMGVKMKAMKPALDEMKERFKDDQMAQMRAQQELMKKYGISMRSGCLSSVLQMAVLIPVYTAVRHYAYPLSQGTFFGLFSLQEPYLPLLVVYVLAFIVSMKIQPQQPSTDAQQQQMQKMMTYLMPVMFFFMMRTLPSAFILYWTIFLVFSTFQTLLFARSWHRSGGDEAVLATLPAELLAPVKGSGRARTNAPTPESIQRKRSSEASAQSAVVERTGEEIPVDGPGGRRESFFGKLFAPMREPKSEIEPELPPAEAPPSAEEPGPSGAKPGGGGNGQAASQPKRKSGSKKS
jgi:YidC/Oxa1 family membrane protein insertase